MTLYRALYIRVLATKQECEELMTWHMNEMVLKLTEN